MRRNMHVHVLGTLYLVSSYSVVYINDVWQRYGMAYQDRVGRTRTDGITHQSINHICHIRSDHVKMNSGTRLHDLAEASWRTPTLPLTH